MSIYTTQVRYICEQFSDLGEGKSPAEYVEASVHKIFNFSDGLPEAHRDRMLSKLLLNYYTREIGEETYGLWKLRLQQKLSIISPYYVDLIKQVEAMANGSPFDDTHFIEQKSGDYVHTKTGQDTIVDKIDNTNSVSGKDEIDTEYGKKTNALKLFNDTPQGDINGAVKTDGDGNYTAGNYITNVTTDSNKTGGNDKETTVYGKSTNQDYTENKTTTYGATDTDTDNRKTETTGKRNLKTNAELLKEYTEQIVNIDRMFVDEFKNCFMQIY